MRSITKSIEYHSRSDVFRIIPIADIHLGNKGCDEGLLKATIDDIASDANTYWVGLGDLAEWINRRDPRFDPADLPSWLMYDLKDIAEAERNRLIKYLNPIGDKCLGMVSGNHEDAILHHNERDVYTTIAEGIGAQEVCLGPSGFIKVQFKRKSGDSKPNSWPMVMFLTHGWWGGRKMGSGANNLESMMGWVDADLLLAGHDHKRLSFSLDKMQMDNKGGVRTTRIHGISCGTFLRDAGYAERKGYRPSNVGIVTINVIPDKRIIQVAV